MSAKGGFADLPGEQVSLNFARITITDNVSGVSATWDVQANQGQ